MIKLLKLASYLSIALAVSTAVFAGIKITRENATFSERADFLDKPAVTEQIRALKITKTDNDKTSPLVTQAKTFALRINPPKPPVQPPKPPIKTNSKTASNTPSIVKKAATEIIRPSTYKLVATCRYEKFPEKSLAMLDVTSKGLLWFRQGDEIGPNKIEKIEDGKIVLIQGETRKTLEVPKQNTVSSLLKSSGSNVAATVSAPASTESTPQPAKRNIPSTIQSTRRNIPPTAGKSTSYPSNRRTVRKRPARPTSEEAQKAAEKTNAELKSILDSMSSTNKEASKGKGDENKLMNAVMKMLEAGRKRTPPKKDTQKDNPK